MLWERLGVVQQSRINFQTAPLSDLDGDGWPEVLQNTTVQGSPGFGPTDEQFWVLSGRDGSTLRMIPGPPPNPNGTVSYRAVTQAGDMDGDGAGDYAVALWQDPPNLRIEVRSGRDDHVIWSIPIPITVPLGASLLGGLDVDGDGRPDLVVTKSRPGSVLAYANDGTLLYEVSGSDDLSLGWSNFDRSLGRVGDLDQDGADDFVVGGGSDSRGAAVVLSGRTGKILVAGYGLRPGDNIGHSVDGCGDMDGDGVPDFVAGNNAFTVRGVVVAFSGATGNPLHVWTSQQLGVGFDGFSVRSGGIDVDRDGVPDVVVGSPEYQVGPISNFVGAVHVLSGRDGSVIFKERNDHPGKANFGESVTALGVRPGSPFPLFAATAPSYDSQPLTAVLYRGRLRVYRGAPPGASVYGDPCAGTLRRAPKIGLSATELDETRVTVHDATAGQPVVLLLGTSRTSFAGVALPRSLGPFGFHGCQLLTSIEVALFAMTGVEGVAAGYAAIDLPALPSANGSVLFGQWLVLGAGEAAPGGVSDAVEFRLR